MDTRKNERSINPSKAGEIYGKFTPSPLGNIRLKITDGKVKVLRMNRKDRRAYLK